MKILIGMPAKDSWGGPAASEPPFAEELRRLGIEVTEETYVYGDKQGSTPTFARAIRVIRAALRFRKLLREDSYDIIHLNTAFDKKTVLRDYVSLLLMGAGRSKVFLKIHGAAAHLIEPKSFVYSRLIAALDRRVDGYGIFTHDEMGSFKRHGLDISKFYIVKNIVDFGTSLPNDDRPQKAPDDECKLLFVARFIPTKGLLETIQACAIMREQGARFTLDCVGDGPIRSDAEALCKRLGLGDSVTFTGYIPEFQVAEYFLTSDIFIFPTRHTEGFPIALFKATAAGMPIVTTRVRAAAEYFNDPKNCLFCTDDPQDIASRVMDLIGNSSLRKQMSFHNRKFGELLTAEAVTEEYLSIYRQICEGNE